MVKSIAPTATSFQRRLAIGFSTTVVVTALIAVVSTFLLHNVINKKDLVIYDYGQSLILTERLRYLAEQKISNFRGYFLIRDKIYLEGLQDNKKQFNGIIEQLKKMASPKEKEGLAVLLKLSEDYDAANADMVERAMRGEASDKLLPNIVSIRPFRQAFEAELNKFVETESRELEAAKSESIQMTQRNLILIAIVSSVAILLAGILAFVLGRTLNQLYQSALRATRLREEMLGIVAHDLRNPIAAIRMSNALLKKRSLETNINAKLLPVMIRIDRITQQMSRLIDDLLVVDKIESGLFTLNRKKENLKTLLSDVVDSFLPLAQEKKIDLRTQFDDTREIICDRDRMTQVFSNLLGNAIKFTPPGGLVGFNAQKRGDEISFSIHDSGPGIANHQLARLFDRHWQAKETAQKGNGLGLYIAQNIVRAHGGEILVTTQVKQGATFSFSLPVKPTLAK